MKLTVWIVMLLLNKLVPKMQSAKTCLDSSRNKFEDDIAFLQWMWQCLTNVPENIYSTTILPCLQLFYEFNCLNYCSFNMYILPFYSSFSLLKKNVILSSFTSVSTWSESLPAHSKYPPLLVSWRWKYNTYHYAYSLLVSHCWWFCSTIPSIE